MNKVDVIICNTNMAVPTTLTLVGENKSRCFVILTDTDNIYLFLSTLNLPNVVVYQYRNIFNKSSKLPKKELLDYLSNYIVENVYFFHFDFGGIANWLLKKISKKSTIYFCKLYNRKPYKKLPLLACYKHKLMDFLLYGVNMDYHDSMIASAPPTFYQRIKAREITIPVNESIVGDIIKIVCNLSNTENTVLLTGSVIMRDYISDSEYNEVITRVIKIVGKDEIVSKCHPRLNDQSVAEKELKNLPSYIPGNLLIDYFDTFIGYDSLLLVEAARKGKKSISLLKMIPTNDMIANSNSIKYLEERLENKGVIYYPKSYDELKSLVQ